MENKMLGKLYMGVYSFFRTYLKDM